jgi:hypothetical protein
MRMTEYGVRENFKDITRRTNPSEVACQIASHLLVLAWQHLLTSVRIIEAGISSLINGICPSSQSSKSFRWESVPPTSAYFSQGPSGRSTSTCHVFQASIQCMLVHDFVMHQADRTMNIEGAYAHKNRLRNRFGLLISRLVDHIKIV